MDCTVDEDRRLKGCDVFGEYPGGLGFGSAALGLTPSFQLTPVAKGSHQAPGGRLRIELFFANPEGPVQHVITNPDWIERPHISARGSGAARITCVVMKQGALNDCIIDSSSNSDSAKLALLIAKKLTLRPKLIDGEPVDGGKFTTTIRFDGPG